MTDHMWVALTMTPIEVEEDGDTLHTFTTELGDEIAREESKVGCWLCFVPLTATTYRSECTAAISSSIL